MLAIIPIIFRESLEIAMILGIVLAATKGLDGRNKWIFGGVLGGLAGAGAVALFAGQISNFADGIGQELFNAMILFTASIFIGWTAIWMRTHARNMAKEFKEIGANVISGKMSKISLSLIIGLAILREGAEIVLFIYGMILSGQSTGDIVAGSLGGVGLGVFIGLLLYNGLIKLHLGRALKVTGWLLILLVCGLCSQAAGYLSAAGMFSSLSKPLWNSSWLLDDSSFLGKALHSLIGYTARPTAIEIIFYAGTLIILLSLIKLTERKHA